MSEESKEYDKWKTQEKSSFSKVSRKINALWLILLVVYFFLGNYFVTTGKIDNSLYWGLNLGFLIIIAILMWKGSQENTLIPESIIKMIAQDELEQKKQRGIEIPFDARVRVTLQGEGIYEQDFATGSSGLVRRDVGFEVIRKGMIKKGVIGIHPYSGIVMGIRWEALGYSGKESKDRVIVPAQVIEAPKKEELK